MRRPGRSLVLTEFLSVIVGESEKFVLLHPPSSLTPLPIVSYVFPIHCQKLGSEKVRTTRVLTEFLSVILGRTTCIGGSEKFVLSRPSLSIPSPSPLHFRCVQDISLRVHVQCVPVSNWSCLTKPVVSMIHQSSYLTFDSVA